jgi:hypothetical protein
MIDKRTFANVCSIKDPHVLGLLSQFDLETSDPLFDGELSPWLPDMHGSNFWSGYRRNKRKHSNSRAARIEQATPTAINVIEALQRRPRRSLNEASRVIAADAPQPSATHQRQSSRQRKVTTHDEAK